MPIRFRCAYCNQLLGIARRKAGTVVRCPTCAGQVIVPTPPEGEGTDDAADGADVPEATDAPGPRVFERSDFDEVLRHVEPAARPAAKRRPASQTFGPQDFPSPAPTHAGPLAAPEKTQPRPPVDVERVEGPVVLEPPEPAPPPDGLVLSPRQVLLLTVAVVLTVLLAFGAGLVIGLMLRPAGRETPEQARGSAALTHVAATR